MPVFAKRGRPNFIVLKMLLAVRDAHVNLEAEAVLVVAVEDCRERVKWRKDLRRLLLGGVEMETLILFCNSSRCLILARTCSTLSGDAGG